jgi:hypothetical protein
MTWKPGVSIADDSFPAGGRRRATGRVLFAQIRLPNGKLYYRCLNTDNLAVARRRMVVVVWTLVAEGRLNPTSKVAQKYPRRAAAEKKLVLAAIRPEHDAALVGGSNSRPAALADRRVTTFFEREAFKRAALASRDLTEAESKAAVAIAMRANTKTWQCNPSAMTIAADINVQERSARRITASLQRKGWLKKEGGGGGYGRSVQYWLLLRHVPMEWLRTLTGESGFSRDNSLIYQVKNPDQPRPKPGPASQGNIRNRFNKGRELASAHPSGALARAEEQILARLVALGADRTDWWFDAYSDEQRAVICGRQIKGQLSDSALQRLIEKRRQAGVR